MKKVFKYIFCVILCSILLSECRENGNVDNNKDDGTGTEKVKDEENQEIENHIPDDAWVDEKITMEYVCSEFGMNESDFDGIDFEDFVNEYNLTYEKIKREDVGFLLQCYKEDYGKPRIPDYRVTLSNLESAELTEENVNSIDIVYFSRIEGEEHNFYIFDFEIGQIIVGSGSESMVSYDDIVGEADEQIKEEIVALIEKYNVFTWQTKIKESNNTGIVGTIDSWLLNIKFDDETMYGVYGRGLNDKYAPADLDLFVEDLKTLATSSVNE